MPRLKDLTEAQQRGVLTFPFMEHDDSPCTPLAKPLAQCKLALVTTAGLHLRGDRPFVRGHGQADTSYRVIPSDTPHGELLQSHGSIGFDHTAFYRDVNICFPMDRLRELVDRGAVGSLSASYYSFMGAQRDPRRIVDETGPEVARLLRAEGVEVVLLTPT